MRIDDVNGKKFNPLDDYTFNVVPTPEDKRDFLAATKLGLDAKDELYGQGEKWVMPRNLIKILDQGRTSMCTGYTAAQVIRQAHFIETGQLEDFSPAFTYGDRGEGEYEGEGDYLKNTCRQILKNGCCKLEDFDFKGTYPQVKAQFNALPSEVMESAKSFKTKAYFRIHMYRDRTEAKEVLDKYKNILLASIPLYDSFVDSYDDGIVPVPDKEKENFRGGHAVAIVGYKYIDNKLHYIVANSWSERVGDKGFFYIPADYPWYESWLQLDYKKMLIEIPIDPRTDFNKNAICFVNQSQVKMHAKVFVYQGRTMVPVRTVAELLGYEVVWHEANQSVEIKEYLNNIWMKIGLKEIVESRYLNIKKVDVAPMIRDSRTFVPIRFVAELMGMDVQWDQERNFAIIKNY